MYSLVVIVLVAVLGYVALRLAIAPLYAELTGERAYDVFRRTGRWPWWSP